jgi:hypothetical protein
MIAIIFGVIGLVMLLISINLVLWCRLKHQRRRRRISEKQLQMTLQRGGDGGFNVEYHSNTGPRRPTAVVQGARCDPLTAGFAWETEPLTDIACASDEASGCCRTHDTAASTGLMSHDKGGKKNSVGGSTLPVRRQTATANDYQKLDYATTGRLRPAMPLPEQAVADTVESPSSTIVCTDAMPQSTQVVYSNNPEWPDAGDITIAADVEHPEDFYEDLDDYLKPSEDVRVVTELQPNCKPEAKPES